MAQPKHVAAKPLMLMLMNTQISPPSARFRHFRGGNRKTLDFLNNSKEVKKISRVEYIFGRNRISCSICNYGTPQYQTEKLKYDH
jgi:hypothetical protein